MLKRLPIYTTSELVIVVIAIVSGASWTKGQVSAAQSSDPNSPCVMIASGPQAAPDITGRVSAVKEEAPAQSPRENIFDEIPYTDLDPEQRIAVQEEFAAVSDRSPEMQVEEMPAYWRLLTWAEHQDLAAMCARKPKSYAFQSLVHSPDQYRGELVQLTMQVRRILSYEAPDNPLGLTRLYEIWGTTSQSRAWLYVCVTAHLPAQMPIGEMVDERATFYGYFFKVQGYLEAEAPPRAPYLPAPLLVGRIAWHPLTAVSQAGSDMWWGVGAVLGAGLIVAIWKMKYSLKSRHASRGFSTKSSNAFENWLAQSQSDRGGREIINDSPSSSN